MSSQVATKSRMAERLYWEKHPQPSGDPNELFFAWYDSVRFGKFAPPKRGLSLEIGPGSGYFSRLAGVDVAVDFSLSALKKLRRTHSCQLVVADAAALPFRDASFGVVYTNDVAHHLKGEGALHCAAADIRRILANRGYWCVADRRPSFYNSVCLALSKIARIVLLAIMKTLRKDALLSGSDNEPPMIPEDYRIIESGMTTIHDDRWRNISVFWIFGIWQFARLVIPSALHHSIAEHLVNLCKTLERILPDNMKCDVCRTMEKRPEANYSSPKC